MPWRWKHIRSARNHKRSAWSTHNGQKSPSFLIGKHVSADRRVLGAKFLIFVRKHKRSARKVKHKCSEPERLCFQGQV